MKTVKRAGIAAGIIAAIAILVVIWVFTKDVVVPRNDKGKLDFGKIEAREREKDQLFSFLGRDINRIDVTVREVNYSYLDESEKEAEGAAKTSPTEEVAKVEAEQKNVKERELSLAREDGKWVLTAPVHGQADQGAADGLATAFAELRIKGDEPDVNPLDPKYGLDNPSLIAMVKLRGGKDIKLLIGRDTPVGSDVYLMLAGDKKLYYASSSVKSSFTKEPKDLRDKKVAEFDKDDVKAVVLDASGNHVVCEQAGKKKGEWWLTQPVEARADDYAVGDVLSAVSSLEAKDFVDDVKSLSAFGLDKPAITVRLDFGKSRDDVVVKFGKHTQKEIKDNTSYSSPSSSSTPKDLVYCTAEGRDEVFLVDAEVEKKLDKKPIDLRDTNLVDFDNNKVNKIVIDHKAGTHLELVKADGKWTIQKPEFANADFSKVDNLLWDLKDLKVVDFLEKQEPSPMVSGLSNPDIMVQLFEEGKDTPVELKLGYKKPDTVEYYCSSSSLSGPVLVTDRFKEIVPDTIDRLKEAKTQPPPPPAPVPPAKQPSAPPTTGTK
jgi:hypothetical protein